MKPLSDKENSPDSIQSLFKRVFYAMIFSCVFLDHRQMDCLGNSIGNSYLENMMLPPRNPNPGKPWIDLIVNRNNILKEEDLGIEVSVVLRVA